MGQVFTMQELADEVGGDVTPRTIRYYIAEGLLPKPDERGQYTQNHLRRLQLIRRYREAFIPIDKIRSQLITLTDVQVEETLKETEATVKPIDSAADYTARLLAGYSASPARASPKRAPAAPAAPTPAAAPGGPNLNSTLSLHRQLNERQNLAPEASADELPDAETWERLTLAPGIELHRRATLTPEADAYLKALLTYASTLERSSR